MDTFKVTIGVPARKVSVYVEAESEDDAVTRAIEKLVLDGYSRDWLNKYAANRHPKIGTCRVEKV